MKSYDNSEKEYLRSLKEYHKESRKLFQNHEWMEKTAVNVFLRIFNVKFDDDDLKKGDDPPDVLFEGANFGVEVTEVQNEGRKRDDEYKDKIKKDEEANELLDLKNPWEHSIPMEFPELLGLIKTAMDGKFDKYRSPKTCQELDLLIYVNLKKRHLTSETKMDCSIEFLSKVKEQGWRSVSFLMGLSAGVVFAQKRAPRFIKELEGVIRRTEDPYLFED